LYSFRHGKQKKQPLCTKENDCIRAFVANQKTAIMHKGK
jgi:hypothetical protein